MLRWLPHHQHPLQEKNFHLTYLTRTITWGNITPINHTHAALTFSGNGMLTLPNTAHIINTASNGSGLISFTTQSGYAIKTNRTEQGEIATSTFYEIVQFNLHIFWWRKGHCNSSFPDQLDWYACIIKRYDSSRNWRYDVNWWEPCTIMEMEKWY